MEEKSESLADKTLDEKAPQKPEPKLEAASLLGKIFTLMRKKREQDVRYSQQEQLQQSQSQLKELEMRIKILESVKESKEEVEDKKPGEKPKREKQSKQKKSKKGFGYPDGFAGFLVDATIVSGLILKYNKESEQTQKEVEEAGKKLEEFENLDILSTERKDTGTVEEPKTKTPEVPTAPAVPTPPVKPVEPPAAPVKPTPSTSGSSEEGMKDYKGRGPATQEPVKPTAKPVEQPKKSPPTATKQPEPPAYNQPTAEKAGKTLSQSIAQKISRGESRGDSKASYTQANIVGKEMKEANIVKGNIDVTTGKPFEKSLDEMTIGEVVELGKRRYVYYTKKYGKPVGGSAMGKYQFIPGSLEEVAKKLYGSDYKSKLYDEQGQENLNAAFISDNATRLKNAGVKASDASLYMMHFFGNPTQAALVINGDENASMKDVLDFWYNKGKQKVKPSDQNNSVAAMTIGQYKAYLRKKGFDFQDIDVTKLNEPIKAPGAGAAIDSTSTQISTAKADAKAAQSSVTNNFATQSQQSPKPKSPQNKKEDDRSAYSKKVNE